jgi:putative transposase
VRFDHGPEFVAYAVADWCRFNGAETIFIDPGSPPLSGQCVQTMSCPEILIA